MTQQGTLQAQRSSTARMIKIVWKFFLYGYCKLYGCEVVQDATIQTFSEKVKINKYGKDKIRQINV
jgi:hypothetical protein